LDESASIGKQRVAKRIFALVNSGRYEVFSFVCDSKRKKRFKACWYRGDYDKLTIIEQL
jgi:hypothetical protein